jgi:hypothetical protein
MRILHEPRSGGRTVLATEVEVADTFLSRARGLMFRSAVPDGFGLYFPFRRAAPRTVHMAFVRHPLDVLWLTDDRVERVATLSPWTGLARASGDALVELPAGAAAAVRAGDLVRLDA